MYASDPWRIVTSLEDELIELLVGAEAEEPLGAEVEEEPLGAEVI